MDYSPFFAQTPQPYQFVGMPPTPTYSGEEKIDPLDTSIFTQPYDFRYPLMSTSNADIGGLAVTMPTGSIGNIDRLDSIDSIDGGVGTEAIATEVVPDQTSTTQPQNPGSTRDGRRSSSEEKDLTPAQSRRKAQNRAAQRAFRERKERHVKDLEAKLSALESSVTLLATDNQRLKLSLQRATTENEILRQQTSRNRSLSIPSPAHSSPSNPDIGAHDTLHSTPSPRGLSHAESEGRLLPAGATWDLIQSHPLVRQGHVDIADVCERLRHAARCNDSGPVFAEREVRNAVEESRRGGGDELI